MFTSSVKYKMSVVMSLCDKFSAKFTCNHNRWSVAIFVIPQVLLPIKYLIAFVARILLDLSVLDMGFNMSFHDQFGIFFVAALVALQHDLD